MRPVRRRNCVAATVHCLGAGTGSGFPIREAEVATLVFFLVLQSFSLLLMSVIIFDNSLSWWIRGFLALFALCLVCGAGVLTWRKGRDKVPVTWHVCRRYRLRAALERRIAQVFIVSTGTALLFTMPYVDLPFRFLFVAVVAGMFAGLRLQCEESLNVTGKKDDVYTLLGHKKKFFEAVRRQENQF